MLRSSKNQLLYAFVLIRAASFGNAHNDDNHNHNHVHHHHRNERNLRESTEGSQFRKSCETHDPTATQEEERNKIVKRWIQKNPNRRRQLQQSPIEVPVCFHVQGTWFGKGMLSDDQLQTQLDALNTAYSSTSCCDTSLDWCNGECSSETGFSFAMATLNDGGIVPGVTTPLVSDPNACRTTTQTSIASFFGGGLSFASIVSKKKLRRGGPETLNIYFRERAGGARTIGYASFPDIYSTEPSQDGVVMNNGFLADGGPESGPFDEGDSLAHEVGHWLGLYHTFQDGCGSDNDGDEIADTPSQSTGSSGCPIGRNSCPGQPGLDPIHNFMDYSHDECMYTFSPGQIDAMHALWDEYRAA